MKPTLLTICLVAFCALAMLGEHLPGVENQKDFFYNPPYHISQQPPGEKNAISQDAPNDLEGTVEVAFRIDASGKVDILNINASNPKLIDYVVKKLGKIQLDQIDSQPGKVIKYRFVFKKQA